MAYAPTKQYEPSVPPCPQNFEMENPSQGPAPPPYGAPYYSAQPAPSVTTYPPPPIIAQPLVVYLGHSPTAMQCTSCRQQVITQVRYEPSLITWVISFIICFFGGIFGCCLIPFLVPSCQDAIHICPACHTIVGRRSPF